MYFRGEGTKRNLDKAQDCFEKADKAGHPQAKTELTEVIKAKGEEFFAHGEVKKAAELGYFPAKLELIDKIPNESERLKEYEEFLSSLTKDNAPKSQRQQVASRISTLKQKMEFDNFKVNKSKADANDSTACYEVAKMYLYGRGVKQNVHSAKHYIDKYCQKMPEDYEKLYELYDLLSKVLEEMANKAHTQANNI